MHVCGLSTGLENFIQELFRWVSLIAEWLLDHVRNDCRNFAVRLRIITQSVCLSSMVTRRPQDNGGDFSDIFAGDETQALIANVIPENSVARCRNAAVAQDVFHEDLGTQMRVGDTQSCDIPFDELVPTIMGDIGVVRAASAKMDDVLHARLLCCVHELFALTQHIDRIPSENEESIDSL